MKHFVAYSALAVTTAIAFGYKRLLIAFALCVGFGALIEIAQILLPTGREGSVLDALANTLGTLFGIMLAIGLERLPGLFGSDRR